MRALLDLNVLIALFDSDHVHHADAARWFSAEAGRGWASCPLTQNGCLRILGSAAYPRPEPLVEMRARLSEATSHPVHEFRADDLSLLDDQRFDAARLHDARQVTDSYLLALAVAHGGRLVTFDRSIALSAVRGARAENLLRL